MRTLSAGLLAAQRANTGTPLTALTINAVNLASRILHIDHKEKPFGGTATIILRNDDKGISTDYRGDKVVIGYGFSGEGTSACAPLWVLHAHKESYEGHLVVVYECIDTWLKLALVKLGSGGTDLTGTIVGSFQVGMKVTGSSSGATGTIIYVGTGYIAVGQTAGTFTTSDNAQWDEDSAVYIDVSAVANFGGGSVGWDGDTTIVAIMNAIGIPIADPLFVVDSSDGIVDSTQPRYTDVPLGTRGIDIVKDLINRTTCAYRVEADEDIHIFAMSDTPGTDYTYDGVHKFLTDIRTSSAVLPNRVLVYSSDFAPGALTSFSGSATDAAAFGRFGMYVDEIVQVKTASNVECQQIADSKLTRIQKESTRGDIEVPMNCGQELFDYVKIEDSRLDENYYGWVGSIQRITEPGKYTMIIGLGGLAGGEDIPSNGEYPLPNINPIPITQLPVIAPIMLPSAIQGYHHNITFAATDRDTVTWTSGTIKFYDGTTQAIASGSVELANGNLRYIYFDLDDGSPNVLKTTEDFLAEMSMRVGVLCLTQRGSAATADAAEVKAIVIPSYGKQPLITADVIYMTGLYDRLPDGTFGKVKSTYISGGRILLSEVTQSASYRTVSDTDTGLWNGKINCFYQDGIPTSLQAGDLWVDTNNNDKMYRATSAGDDAITPGEWELVQDAYTALTLAAAKRRVYTSEPTTPYEVGDLWADGTNPLKRCITALASGAYNAAHWETINLDEIADGSSWQRVAAADLSSGHLKLTTATTADGEWYDYSGVTISSVIGVQFLGGSNALFYFTNLTNLVGSIDGIDDAIHILGSPDILISCSGSGGVSINSGGNATAATADDIIMDSDEDVMIHADSGVDITAEETMGSPADGDINLSCNEQIALYGDDTAGAGPGIKIMDKATTFDLDSADALSDIGDVDRYDHVHCQDVFCDELSVTNPPWVDEYDDLTLLRMMKQDALSPRKIDPLSIPLNMRASNDGYVSKKIYKHDKVTLRRINKLSISMQILDGRIAKAKSIKEKYYNTIHHATAKEFNKVKTSRGMIQKINNSILKMEKAKVKTKIRMDNLNEPSPELIANWELMGKQKIENRISLSETLGLILGAMRQVGDITDELKEEVRLLKEAA